MRYISGLVGQEMVAERRGKPNPHQMIKCPRCESPDTKFCYYNNYSTTQPRYFCKNCKRYWTNGGALRNVPVGGGLRKNKRSKNKTNTTTSSSHHKPSTSSPHHNPSTSSTDDHNNHGLPNPSDLTNPGYPSNNNYLFNPRIYETGDQATHALSYHQLNYYKNMSQLNPGFNYPGPLSTEGLQKGFGLLGPSRSQSNSGETTEVSAGPRSEAMKTASEAMKTASEAAKTAQFAPSIGLNERRSSSSYGHSTTEGLQQGFHYEDTSTARKDQENNNNGVANDSDNNNNYSNLQSLGYGNHEQQQQGKWRGRAMEGMQNLDAAMAHYEEGITNVVNVYDWQHISEGLFAGSEDFFYMPTHPTNWSDFARL